MANRRNHRNPAIGNSPHHLFFIEGPQILERATATRHNQKVGTRQRPLLRHRIKAADRARHLTGGVLPLHQRSPKQHPHAEPVGQPVQDIADYRAGRAGDHPDHLGHPRHRLFPVSVKQPFGSQPTAALLKLFQHGALTGHFHGRYNDLIFRATAIDGQLAGDNDLKPLFRLHAERTRHRLPADPIKRVALIFQGEIEMPRGSARRP